MDGGKKTLSYSLQWQLQAGMAVIIVVAASLGAALAYWAAWHEAHELQDGVLRQAAQWSRVMLRSGVSVKRESLAATDVEAPIYIGLIDQTGQWHAQHAGEVLLKLPRPVRAGLQNTDVGSQRYRMYVELLPDGAAVVVAQDVAIRNDIARSSALGVLLPYVAITPVVLLLLSAYIRRVFTPVARLVEDIEQRSDAQLHALDHAALPVELLPFVDAINRLLLRVATSRDVQKRFIADAAHELRSPLTALSLQAEQLADLSAQPVLPEHLHTLQQGIVRVRHLLEQLLDMARAQTGVSAVDEVVSSQVLFCTVLEQHMPAALAKEIDIGIVGGGDVRWYGNRTDWQLLLSNLVNNAIIYTPARGKIDLSATALDGVICLSVSDNGPGIAEAERDQVMEAFYRINSGDAAGSGLGLSIVQAVARKYSATVELTYSDPVSKSGLRVQIFLPAQVACALHE